MCLAVRAKTGILEGSNAINCLDRDPHGRAVDLDGSSQRSTHDRWPKAESSR
jgi:hypothetical protein